MNIIATFIALVVFVGACIILSILIGFVIYEAIRFVAFLWRAYGRHRARRLALADKCPLTVQEAAK